jgi:transposase
LSYQTDIKTQKLMQTQRKQLNFDGQNIYVGIDVHLKSWKVTIMTEKLTHKTFSQPPKAEVLHDYLRSHYPGGTYHSAYEAGYCGYWIHNRLKALNINSIVVNAADIPTTDKERVQKEDKRDSRKIAGCLRGGSLTPIYVPSLKNLDDRGLLRTRGALVKDLARNKNRVKSFLYFHGVEYPEIFDKAHTHWSKRFMQWLGGLEFADPSGRQSLDAIVASGESLRANILQVTGQIRALSRTEAYGLRVALLRSIPGIGLITAMTILTELEDMGRFRSLDHLASFIGLVQSTRSSGDRDRAGNITPRGHGILRGALIESAWVAIRFDPALTKSYYGYCNRMEPNKAIVRIAKKLASRIRYVLRTGQAYGCSVVE